MSQIFIGPWMADPDHGPATVAFLTEGTKGPAGWVPIRQAIVTVEDLDLMVMHFTEEDLARGALDADRADGMAEALRGYADSLRDDEEESDD